jgi:hypothetical protein
MIINLKNKEDLITIDLRLKQIRYLNEVNKQGEILFIELSKDDCEGYEYLFNEDKKLLLKTIKEDLLSFLGKKVLIKNLEILK